MTATPNHQQLPEDPDAALATILHRMNQMMKASNAASARGEATRLRLLHIHIVTAFPIAIFFAAVGPKGLTGTTWNIVRIIPAAPYSLAALLGLGATILAVAVVVEHQRLVLIGLTVLAAWYATIAVTFGGAIVQWLFVVEPTFGELWTLWISGGGDLHGVAAPSWYAPIVYAKVALILLVHLHFVRRHGTSGPVGGHL